MPVLREWWTRVRVFNIFIEKIRSQSRIVLPRFLKKYKFCMRFLPFASGGQEAKKL